MQVYIIYSKSLDKYYVGESEDANKRLVLHNSAHFSNSFTARARDWRLVMTLTCENRVTARKIEVHIKRMKSRKYIEDLITYPEMRIKLLNRFSLPGSSR